MERTTVNIWATTSWKIWVSPAGWAASRSTQPPSSSQRRREGRAAQVSIPGIEEKEDTGGPHEITLYPTAPAQPRRGDMTLPTPLLKGRGEPRPHMAVRRGEVAMGVLKGAGVEGERGEGRPPKQRGTKVPLQSSPSPQSRPAPVGLSAPQFPPGPSPPPPRSSSSQVPQIPPGSLNPPQALPAPLRPPCRRRPLTCCPG